MIKYEEEERCSVVWTPVTSRCFRVITSVVVWPGLVEARHISPGECQPVSARYKYDNI